MSARALFNSALAVIALATAACGGGSDSTGPSPLPSDGGSNPAPAPSANKGTLQVSNPTTVTVYYLKVRACGTTATLATEAINRSLWKFCMRYMKPMPSSPRR